MQIGLNNDKQLLTSSWCFTVFIYFFFVPFVLYHPRAHLFIFKTGLTFEHKLELKLNYFAVNYPRKFSSEMKSHKSQKKYLVFFTLNLLN